MSTAAIVGILVALVVVGGGLVWYLTDRKRRTESLQNRYGPEYTRTVHEIGSQSRAEEELVKRQKRVELLDIRPLLAEQRELFADRWRTAQATFVDDPAGAVTDADRLVEEVMKVRGYPISDFEQRAADLSVHHSRFVENYRAARDIAERHRRNAASTEDLRMAIVFYRELFEDLLEDREHAPDPRTERVVDRPVERDVALSADDVPTTDEHEQVDNQRRDRANRDIRP
jgi:hypothetical protein